MAHFDLNKIIVRFKIKYPRFEYIVDTLPIELDDSISTACTDGEKLYFNKEFMETLDDEQQLFNHRKEENLLWNGFPQTCLCFVDSADALQLSRYSSEYRFNRPLDA